MNKFVIILSIISATGLASASIPGNIKAQDVISGKALEINTRPTESLGSVFVFMSSKCPCSNSHVSVLKNLAGKFTKFNFYAVHSNADEPVADAQKYFRKAGLPFPVVQDSDTKLADLMQAFKTPHAFVLDNKGEILYQGGVTNSSNAPSADENFLDEVLSDLTAGKPARMSEGRTLGCVILRKNEIKK